MAHFQRRLAVGLTNTKVLIEASRAELFGWVINNPNASTVYVQVFDAASINDVNLGVTQWALPLKILANSGVVLRDGGDSGIPFLNGIVVAATSTEGGNGAPAAPLSAVFFSGRT